MMRILMLTATLRPTSDARQLVWLATHLPRDRFAVRVCALTAGEELRAKLNAAEIPVTVIGWKGAWDRGGYLRLVETMQDAVPEGTGGIAAILGLELEVIRDVCAEAANGEVLEAVNLNSPGQIVIAGHKTAVERGMALAKVRGAKRALLLPMSVPSHCALMKPAAKNLSQYLQNITVAVPVTPVIQNADVRAFDNAAAIKQALVEQLYRPVRWIETIQQLVTLGSTHVVECVPGKILTGLTKRIDANLNCMAITDSASLEAAIAQVERRSE